MLSGLTIEFWDLVLGEINHIHYITKLIILYGIFVLCKGLSTATEAIETLPHGFSNRGPDRQTGRGSKL